MNTYNLTTITLLLLSLTACGAAATTQVNRPDMVDQGGQNGDGDGNRNGDGTGDGDGDGASGDGDGEDNMGDGDGDASGGASGDGDGNGNRELGEPCGNLPEADDIVCLRDVAVQVKAERVEGGQIKRTCVSWIDEPVCNENIEVPIYCFVGDMWESGANTHCRMREHSEFGTIACCLKNFV